MGAWLKELWTDEAKFRTATRTLFRFSVAVAGLLVEHNIIPTGFAGGGEKLGGLITALALLVPAGQQNAKQP